MPDQHALHLTHAPDCESVHHEDDHPDLAADAVSRGGARVQEALLETARCGDRHHPMHLGHAGGHDHLGRPTKSGDQSGPGVFQRSAIRQRQRHVSAPASGIFAAEPSARRRC